MNKEKVFNSTGVLINEKFKGYWKISLPNGFYRVKFSIKYIPAESFNENNWNQPFSISQYNLITKLSRINCILLKSYSKNNLIHLR